MKHFILSATLLFSLTSCSQENNNLKINSFSGHWISDESNYYLTIKDTVFTTFKYVAALDETNDLTWKRVSSPGVEKFIYKKEIKIKTNYYIIKDRYQVYVTYTLVDDQTLKAEFKGSLKNEFYYKKIKYKRVKLN